MTDPALRDIARLTDALYRAELSKVQDLIRQETALRRDLAQLEERRRSNMALPVAHLDGVRQIGADVLWQGWVGRTRAELQMRLAQVLARKGQMMKALRRAHGKSQASNAILHTADTAKNIRLQKQILNEQGNLMLLKFYSDS